MNTTPIEIQVQIHKHTKIQIQNTNAIPSLKKIQIQINGKKTFSSPNDTLTFL